MYQVALFLLSLVPMLHGPALPAASVPLQLSRLDQTSRQLVIRNLHPGGQVEVYVNGRLLGTEIARSSTERLVLRKRLAPGSAVTVIAGRSGHGQIARSTTVVQNDYLQYHYDLAKTGLNNAETILTTANVKPGVFGHLLSLPVDGFVLAQPLYVANLTIGSTVHNVTIVATENDSVYAFDPDTGAQLWHQNYANPGSGANPIPYQAIGAQNISPVVGITSTPAIDADAGIIYFVAAIQQTLPSGFAYHQFLHAVDLTTGLDRPGSPLDIVGTAHLNNGDAVVFNALRQLNRASMLLANGSVYVSFGNHDDVKKAKLHGWIFQYDASTLAPQRFFNTTLDLSMKYGATIWAAGWGPSTDDAGNLIFATGDGPFDADTGGNNWGDTVMKMTAGLTVTDFFTPQDQATLDSLNHDLGGGGVMLLPDQPGAYPHLATIAGEEGTIYLLNRDALGHYTPGGPDDVVQELPQGIHKLVGGPTYYSGPTGNLVYYCGTGDPLKAYRLDTSPTTQLTLAALAPAKCGGGGGGLPVVSSDGTTPGTGIVWVSTRPANKATNPVLLQAFDAADVTHQLIHLPVALWQNLHNPPFLTPTVINGRVFVGTSNSVEEFGLLSSMRNRSLR